MYTVQAARLMSGIFEWDARRVDILRLGWQTVGGCRRKRGRKPPPGHNCSYVTKQATSGPPK